MNIVVDTSVWSLFLRRRRFNPEDPWVRAFRGHVDSGDAIHLLGMILQELLDGVPSERVFDYVRGLLLPFPLLPVRRETHVLAAQISNRCRRSGVQATVVDALIAAACVEHAYPLLTADRDFTRIAEHCDLALLPPLA